MNPDPGLHVVLTPGASPTKRKVASADILQPMSSPEDADSQRSWSARRRAGPMLLVLAGLVVGSVALTIPSGDGSYWCSNSALTLVSPEPEGRSGDGFDVGRACNHDARVHGAVAAGVFLPFAVGSGIWSRQRRRVAWR